MQEKEKKNQSLLHSYWLSRILCTCLFRSHITQVSIHSVIHSSTFMVCLLYTMHRFRGSLVKFLNLCRMVFTYLSRLFFLGFLCVKWICFLSHCLLGHCQCITGKLSFLYITLLIKHLLKFSLFSSFSWIFQLKKC